MAVGFRPDTTTNRHWCRGGVWKDQEYFAEDYAYAEFKAFMKGLAGQSEESRIILFVRVLCCGALLSFR